MTFLDDFLAHLNAHGYEAKHRIREGGAWNRLNYEGEKRSSGRCFLVIDGDKAFGSFGSDKDPNYFRPWTSWDNTQLNEAEIKSHREWVRKIEKQRADKDKKSAARLQRWLRDIYKNLDAAPHDHKYLVKKKVAAHTKVRYRPKTKELIIPCYKMRGDKLTITSFQKIDEKGRKLFIKNGIMRGAFFPMAEKNGDWSKIYIAEGYSTGLTIKQHIGGQVIVAFNAHNIVEVARIFRKKYPDAEIIIAGDNDQFPSKNWPSDKIWVNTGAACGEKASSKYGAHVLLPEFKECDHGQKPTDWNDYFCLYGEDALRLAITCEKQGAEAGGSLPQSLPQDASALATTEGISKELITGEDTQENWSQLIRWKNEARGVFDKAHSNHNAILWLTHQKNFAGTFIYNEFSHSRMIYRPLPWDNPINFKPREIEDEDLTQLRAAIGLNDIVISSNTEMLKILHVVSSRNVVHPIKDYFERLEWDNVPRIETWLTDYCGANNQDMMYLAAVGSCFLKAGVKRVFNAGEKFDHMLVLEGGQAAGKSSTLKALATFGGEEFFSDQLHFSMLDHPHLFLELKGKFIIEFAELSGLSKKDRNRVKSWITQQTDRWTPKHSNIPQEYPRQYLLAGSTNDDNWLNDPTGGRRFWPVRVGEMKVEKLKEVVDQLWAEAVHKVNAGEKHYIDTDDEVYRVALREQHERYEGGRWDDIIDEYLECLHEVRIDDILFECIRKDKDKWTQADRRDVGSVLRAGGWKQVNKRMPSGRQTKVWRRAK